MTEPEISPLDHKVMKLVQEASKGLKVLQKEVYSAVKNLNKGDVDSAKAQAVAKKVSAFMGKYVAVTKLQGSKAYGQLLPGVQKYVDWMDGVMSDLLGTLNALNATKSFIKKDPNKNFTIMVKTCQTYVSKYNTTPKGVGTLVKQIQKSGTVDGPQGAMLGILPMAIILWMIVDTIVRGFKKKP